MVPLKLPEAEAAGGVVGAGAEAGAPHANIAGAGVVVGGEGDVPGGDGEPPSPSSPPPQALNATQAKATIQLERGRVDAAVRMGAGQGEVMKAILLRVEEWALNVPRTSVVDEFSDADQPTVAACDAPVRALCAIS